MSSVPLVKWDEEALGSSLYSLLGMQALNCVFSWSDRRCFRLGVTPGILSLLSTEDPAEVPGALWRSLHTLTAAVDAVVYQAHAGLPADGADGKAREAYPSTAAFLDAMSRPGGRELLRPAAAAAVPCAGAAARSKAAIAEARELLAQLDSGNAEHGSAMRIMVLAVLQKWVTSMNAVLGDTAAALLAHLLRLAEGDDPLDRLQQRHTNASGDGVPREEVLLSVMAKGIRLLEHFVKQAVRCAWFARCMYNVPTFQAYAADDTPHFRVAKYDPVLHIPVQLANGAGTPLPAPGDKVVQLSPMLHDTLQRRLEKRAPHAERLLVVLQSPANTGQKLSAADIEGCVAFLRSEQARENECAMPDRQPTAPPAAVARAEDTTALTGVRAGTVSGGATQPPSSPHARVYAPPIAPRLQPTVTDGVSKSGVPLQAVTSTFSAPCLDQLSVAALPEEPASAAHESPRRALRSPTQPTARKPAAAAGSASLPPPAVAAAGSDLECSARADFPTDGVLGASKPRTRGKSSKTHGGAAKHRVADIRPMSTPSLASAPDAGTGPPGSPTFDDEPTAAGSKRSREDAHSLRGDIHTNTLEPVAEASSGEDFVSAESAPPESRPDSDRRTPRERTRKAARKDPAFEW